MSSGSLGVITREYVRGLLVLKSSSPVTTEVWSVGVTGGAGGSRAALFLLLYSPTQGSTDLLVTTGGRPGREPGRESPLCRGKLPRRSPPSVGWSVAWRVGSSTVRGLFALQTRPGCPDHSLPAGLTQMSAFAARSALHRPPARACLYRGASVFGVRVLGRRTTAPLLTESGPPGSSLRRGLLRRFPCSGRASVVRQGCEASAGASTCGLAAVANSG